MKSEVVRKPFRTPELTVFGDIREITQTVGNKTTVADGGQPGNRDKTA